MLQAIVILLLFTSIIIESKGPWSYANTRQWLRGNRYCGGNSQSPIDLQFSLSQYDHRLRQIYLEDRYPREPAELVNSGHTAQLNLQNYYVLKNVAPESEDYKVEQIHFHWGHQNDNMNGSEHLHEGQSYPLEMHMVSYSSLYSNIREAMTNTRALAVVGAFFEISPEPNPLLQPLIDALAHVRAEGQHASVSEEFSLKALIGEERTQRYYRYDGSLTTPPCYETVIWTVLLDPLKISSHQLNAFKNLYNAQAKLMHDTYRPVRPLGTRKLFRSFYSKDINEDLQQKMAMMKSSQPNLINNMKLIVILSSLLMCLF